MVSGGFVVDSRIVHVRFQGKSWDVPFSALGLGDQADDRAVREAATRYLSAPQGALDAHTVERLSNGNIALRPGAAG